MCADDNQSIITYIYNNIIVYRDVLCFNCNIQLGCKKIILKLCINNNTYKTKVIYFFLSSIETLVVCAQTLIMVYFKIHIIQSSIIILFYHLTILNTAAKVKLLSVISQLYQLKVVNGSNHIIFWFERSILNPACV